MLVLSRHRDETIMVGDDVEITVVDIRGDKVRLGIQAPTRIAVHRKEVYEAIQQENRQAARLASEDEMTLVSALASAQRRVDDSTRHGRQQHAALRVAPVGVAKPVCIEPVNSVQGALRPRDAQTGTANIGRAG